MPIQSTGAPCRHIFVYGSLMSSVATPLGARERSRLSGESRSLGTATTKGRLYDLGQYPGMTPAISPADTVEGELLELLNPTATLIWLDQYEGVRYGFSASGDYRREICSIELQKSKFAPRQPASSGLAQLGDRTDGDGAPARPFSPASSRQAATTLNRTVQAWIYIYQGALNQDRHIPSGSWLKR